MTAKLATEDTNAQAGRREAVRLTSEAEALAEARRIADEIRPIALDHEREAELPRWQLDQLSQSGLTAIAVPAQDGGLGASIETIVEIVRIISQADAGVGQILQLHNAMIAPILAIPNYPRRNLFIASILNGDRFSIALGELGGRNKLELKTRLTAKPDGGFLLNGRKFYSTGSYLADWISVGVETPSGAPGFVIVPRDAPGLVVFDDWRAFGQRNTMSGTVTFEDVFVPQEGAPHPLKPLRAGLTRAQILHAAIDTGIARGALDAVVSYLRERARPWVESGAERLADEPHVIKQIGEFTAAVHTAEIVLRHAAQTYGRFLATPADEPLQSEAILAVAHARVQADKAALFVGGHLFDLLGASSVQEQYNLDRFWRNARAHTTHDPIRWRLHLIGNHVLNEAVPIDFPLPPQARALFLGE